MNLQVTDLKVGDTVVLADNGYVDRMTYVREGVPYKVSKVDVASKPYLFNVIGDNDLPTHCGFDASDISAIRKEFPIGYSAMGDPVSTPSHYKRFKYEPIKVIIDWALSPCLANVIKYVARAEHKGTQIQDLKKALCYLTWEIERLETGDITTGGDK